MSERARLLLALTLVAVMAGGWLWLQSSEREPLPVRSGEVDAVKAALNAWGRWAGDGDLSHVAETFADGPQLAQIRREDETIVPGPQYEFVLAEAEVVEPGVVRGTVVLDRPGESEQRFHWDIEMIEVDGVWRLWTVRTSPEN